MEICISGNNYLFNNHMFNVLTTSHAIIMIFFFLIPSLISGFGNILVPVFTMVPDIAFPRINNMSLWTVIPAFFMVVIATLNRGRVGTGWTLYPPLSSKGHSRHGVDCAIFALHLAGASSIMRRINFIVTIMVFGSYINYVPIFNWAIYTTTFLLVLSLPVLAAGITMILFDRNVNGKFFGEQNGGDCILFQHLF